MVLKMAAKKTKQTKKVTKANTIKKKTMQAKKTIKSVKTAKTITKKKAPAKKTLKTQTKKTARTVKKTKTVDKGLEELKKYNRELEMHLSGMKFDMLANKNVFDNENYNHDEFSTLLANNLLDLKTEMALMRKNLVDGMEGMVLRMIKENNDTFAKQIQTFYNQIFLEVKNSFNGYIEEVTQELSNIKKDFNHIKISAQKEAENVQKIKEELALTNKESMESMTLFKREVMKMLNNQNIDLDKRVAMMEASISELMKDHKTKSNNHEIYIRTMLDRIEQLNNNVDLHISNISERNTVLENNIHYLSQNVNNLAQMKDIKKEIQIEKPSKEKPSSNEKGTKQKESEKIIITKRDYEPTTVSKILDVDARIRRLESLK